jgi:hypothetical protein
MAHQISDILRRRQKAKVKSKKEEIPVGESAEAQEALLPVTFLLGLAA